MKKFLSLLVAVLAAFTLSASHFAGAEIGYEYISTNANGSHQYKVHLQIYRDISGIPLNLNQSLCITSSCFGQQTSAFTFLPVLPQNGGNIRQALPVPDLASCVNASDPNMVTIEMYFFETTVNLPGNCSDFKFSWHGNARNTNNIDNLVFTGTCGSDLYVEAILNNTIGQNTSPVFVNPAAKAFCVGAPFTWSQAATEPDSDSLRYQFGNPLNSPFGTTCVTPCNATFAPGYSVQQPMSTVSGITIDERYGTFYFTPSQIETDVVNVIVEEYRQDPGTGLWLMIGNTVRDLQIPIVGQCLEATAAGPKIDASAPGFSQQNIDVDSLRGYLEGIGFTKSIFDSTLNPPSYSMSVVDYSCGDSIITLNFNVDVVCKSISPDGTDFRLIGPDSSMTPIPAVSYVCGSDLTTNNIALLLHQPLDINGDYFLQIKNGNDGNTLQNECGFNLTPFYTIKINVTGCKDPVYQLENVTVVRDSMIQIDWTAIDSTINDKLFTSWAIMRGQNNQFWVIDQVNDPNARSYVDLSAGPEEVDTYEYQYAVQLVQNYDYLPPTRDVNNILLEYETGSRQTDFTWSDYNGWTNPEYWIEYTMQSSAMNWTTLEGPSGSLQAYTYTHPKIDVNNEGIYAFRVKASDPTGNSPFISESNWLYLEFEAVPDEKHDPYITDIPNIFTPNGDNQNDHFEINRNTYSHISISIFNRWGKLVYQDLDAESSKYQYGLGWDGTDMNTGNLLSEGVYFYQITANDQVSGKAQQLKGPLTIVRDMP